LGGRGAKGKKKRGRSSCNEKELKEYIGSGNIWSLAGCEGTALGEDGMTVVSIKRSLAEGGRDQQPDRAVMVEKKGGRYLLGH